MSLTRATVTAASRTMLPTYPAFCGAIGLNFLIRGADLTTVGVFYEVAHEMLPLRVWGFLFLVVAVVQVGALVYRRRWTYQVGLALMVGLMTTWAFVGAVAAVRDMGSYTAPVWPAFVALACIASFRSLNTGEQQ